MSSFYLFRCLLLLTAADDYISDLSLQVLMFNFKTYGVVNHTLSSSHSTTFPALYCTPLPELYCKYYYFLYKIYRKKVRGKKYKTHMYILLF